MPERLPPRHHAFEMHRHVKPTLMNWRLDRGPFITQHTTKHKGGKHACKVVSEHVMHRDTPMEEKSELWVAHCDDCGWHHPAPFLDEADAGRVAYQHGCKVVMQGPLV